jgi:hypothetical protein
VAFRNHIAATSKASNSTANGHVVGTAAEDHQEQQQHEKLWILKTAQVCHTWLECLLASAAIVTQLLQTAAVEQTVGGWYRFWGG